MSATKRSTAQKPAPSKEQPVPEPNPPVEEKAIALRSTENLPAFMQMDMNEYAGAGTSDNRADNIVPYLYIAQKTSPQVNPRDAKHIEGLVPGMVFDVSTRQMWDAENGQGPKLIQAYFESAEVEWVIRGQKDPNGRQGFIARHSADTDLLNQVREVPKEGGGQGMRRMLPNGHQLVTTKYHYCELADDLRPVALSLSSSGLGPSRALNTLLRNKKLRNPNRKPGQPSLIVAPSFSTLLRLRTVWVSNDAGDWFTVAFDDLGWVTNDYLDAYEEAKNLYHSAITTGIKTAEPEDSTDGNADTRNDEVDASVDVTDDSPL
jgi:hypothetical protein